MGPSVFARQPTVELQTVGLEYGLVFRFADVSLLHGGAGVVHLVARHRSSLWHCV